jgi:uncharacterized membrane protein YagU involved in acid resistance
MNTRGLKWGVFGGVAGGLIFGGIMGMMGMLPMIGQMVGQPSAFAGFAVHMINSVIIGVGFALVLGGLVSSLTTGLTSGLAYGAAWWLLGPLTLMPLMMGMGLGVNWNAEAAAAMLPSLMGHLMYGAILGVTYAWLEQNDGATALATAD